MIDEKYLRSSAKKRRLNFSSHAIQRMIERDIDVAHVYKTVQYGKIPEIQNFPEFKDIHVVFQELTPDFPAYYVIVAHSVPQPTVVTVCLTLSEVWEWADGFLKRKGRYK